MYPQDSNSIKGGCHEDVQFLVVAVLVLMIMASTVVVAEDQSGSLTLARYARAEANLLLSLKSENQGVRESAAYLLGELRSDKARSSAHGDVAEWRDRIEPDRGCSGIDPHW